MGINCITVSGNLGKDPELKEVGETSIVNFSVANNRRTKKGGEWIDHTNWLNVVAFGAQAKAIANNLKKGSQVAVTGELRIEQYTDKDGNKRQSIEVRANDVQFLGTPKDSYDGPDPEIGF